jgi:hypothetical protein
MFSLFYSIEKETLVQSHDVRIRVDRVGLKFIMTDKIEMVLGVILTTGMMEPGMRQLGTDGLR